MVSRALLDDWESGVGGMALLESEQIAAASDLPADPISMPSAWTRVNEMLQEIQGSIDARFGHCLPIRCVAQLQLQLRNTNGGFVLHCRYVSICCPALEDGTRGMLSSLAGPAQGITAVPNGSRTTGITITLAKFDICRLRMPETDKFMLWLDLPIL